MAELSRFLAAEPHSAPSLHGGVEAAPMPMGYETPPPGLATTQVPTGSHVNAPGARTETSAQRAASSRVVVEALAGGRPTPSSTSLEQSWRKVGQERFARRESGAENRYSYVRNNPIRLSDPTGFDDQSIFGTITNSSYNLANAVVQTAADTVSRVINEDVDSLRAAVDSGTKLEVASASVQMAVDVSTVYFLPALGLKAAPQFLASEVKSFLQSAVVGRVTDTLGAGGSGTSGGDKVGTIPKPPQGPGSVPKYQRDPKRFLSPSERATQRDAQGGTCAGCGKPIDSSNSRGHHVERHSDGGQTVPGNHVEVCKDCHI